MLDIDGTQVKHEEVECEVEVETVEEVLETVVIPEIKHDGIEIVSAGKLQKLTVFTDSRYWDRQDSFKSSLIWVYIDCTGV